ncbi:Two component system histidine kinase [Granulibacter bethesdensis]|uniref:Two component system histidine kinase n=1 Tax=Granulibacter bethesdensis TaxID=364410 RepID=A0AAN0VGR0_9PROT|nr:Two component system histidine kinase [Granulibacter bethesdensis]
MHKMQKLFFRMPFWPCLTRSLQGRLVLLPAFILLVGLIVSLALSLHRANHRIRNEMESGFRLGRVLVEAVLVTARAMPTQQDALTMVAQQLPRVRHLDLLLLPAPEMMAMGMPPLLVGQRPRVPHWFVDLLPQPIVARSFPVLYHGAIIGQIIMIANPFDEMKEVWGELCLIAVELAAISVAIVLLIMLATSLSLRPLKRLAEGFEALEAGEYATRLGPVTVAELQPIAVRFDSLAARLQRITQDNHHLIDRLISMQEAERRDVAHELHDEFGPAFFAIRAELASLTRWCRDQQQREEQAGLPIREVEKIESRVLSIGSLVDAIQNINAAMLERLRPMVLEEMGLPDALERLVEDWRRRVPQTQWDIMLCTGLEQTQTDLALTLFRLVQECLTNIARHADARHVEVGFFWLPPRLPPREKPAGAAQDGKTEPAWLGVYVRDDGTGFSGAPSYGYGLLGMTERVRAAGGKLYIGDNGQPGAAGKLAEMMMASQKAGLSPEEWGEDEPDDGHDLWLHGGAVIFAGIPWQVKDGGVASRSQSANIHDL